MSTIYLSPYSLDTYSKCGERYRLRYVEHAPEPVGPSPAAVRGRALHKGAETDLRVVAAQHAEEKPREDLPLEAVQQAAVEEFERAERGEDVYTREDGTEEKQQRERPAWALHGEEPGLNKDLVARGLTPAWYERIAPTVRPAAIEEWAAIDLAADGLRVRLRGRLDVMPADGVVADLKHTKKAFGRCNFSTETDAHVDHQLTAYDVLYRAVRQEAPRALGWDTVQLETTRKTGETRVSGVAQPRVRPRTDDEIARYLDLVTRIARGIQAGIFVPADRSRDWWCGEKWCPYWRICRFGGA